LVLVINFVTRMLKRRVEGESPRMRESEVSEIPDPRAGCHQSWRHAGSPRPQAPPHYLPRCRVWHRARGCAHLWWACWRQERTTLEVKMKS
jgi:hypothetical protein